MIDQENNISGLENDNDEEYDVQHHRRNHSHRIRVKQKFKVKKGSSKVKKKAKKYVIYLLWTILIILFVVSIYILIEELGKNPETPLKDRRNRSEKLIKENPITKTIELRS